MTHARGMRPGTLTPGAPDVSSEHQAFELCPRGAKGPRSGQTIAALSDTRRRQTQACNQDARMLKGASATLAWARRG